LLLEATAQRGAVHDGIPKRLDPGARYVLYLHGRIIEDQGPRPTHERWGTYEYRKILDTLAADGLTVISEQRPPATDMDRFAEHVVQQVRALLAAKVPANHITVIGFSKGGGIAIRTSSLLKNDKVNFVFLAACGDGDFSESKLDVRGRILSIYEESDEAGRSCAQLFAKSKGAGKHEEIRIAIGGGHGAFFRPRKEWITPVLAWVRQER
jgi:dienelactone hydrolase